MFQSLNVFQDKKMSQNRDFEENWQWKISCPINVQIWFFTPAYHSFLISQLV